MKLLNQTKINGMRFTKGMQGPLMNRNDDVGKRKGYETRRRSIEAAPIQLCGKLGMGEENEKGKLGGCERFLR